MPAHRLFLLLVLPALSAADFSRPDLSVVQVDLDGTWKILRSETWWHFAGDKLTIYSGTNQRPVNHGIVHIDNSRLAELVARVHDPLDVLYRLPGHVLADPLPVDTAEKGHVTCLDQAAEGAGRGQWIAMGPD